MFSRRVIATARRVAVSRSLSTAQANSSSSFYARNKDKVPIYGAIVGTCALMFQIFALYPWHHELSAQFEVVEKKVNHVSALTKEHDQLMKRMLELEEQVKAKERKILEHEEEILQAENKILSKVDQLLKAQIDKNNARKEA